MSVPNELVAYETLDEGRIARIWLNRPEAHNAQSRGLLVQLDEAFLRPWGVPVVVEVMVTMDVTFLDVTSALAR